MDEEGVQLLIIISSLALIALLVTLISLFLYFQKKKMEFLLERKNEASRYKEELMKAKAEISEQTLQTIGWELHDNIGQLLSVAKLKLSMVLQNKNMEERSGLEEIKNIIGQSLSEVRQLSKSLNRDYVNKQGLFSSIKAEIDRYNKLRFFKASIQVSGDDNLDIDSKDSLIIFRILQEQFSNIIKHAKASELEVNVENNSADLKITVRDNGVGFDKEQVKSGAGLFNIKNRAKLIGADIKIESSLGHGTTLVILYPKNYNS